MGTKIPVTARFSLAENHIHADWGLFILDINNPPLSAFPRCRP
jgi:hypothetical protein